MPFTEPRRADGRRPRWYRPGVLGDISVIAGRLVFNPNVKHPGLKDFGVRELGEEADPAIMAKVEAVFREALATKKSWKAAKKASRAATAEGGTRLAA